jgi:hypothetical protein
MDFGVSHNLPTRGFDVFTLRVTWRAAVSHASTIRNGLL